MEKTKLIYTGDEPGMVEKISEAITRNELHAEVIARDDTAQKLTRRFETRSPAKGEAGLKNMMALGTMAPDRWLPSAPLDKNGAVASNVRKVKQRVRNKTSAASRRKNRR